MSFEATVYFSERVVVGGALGYCANSSGIFSSFTKSLMGVSLRSCLGFADSKSPYKVLVKTMGVGIGTVLFC